MSDSLFGPPRDPTTDTLDKRLWIGTRIAQAEERLQILSERIDVVARRLGPAITLPEPGPSKEDQLEKRFEAIISAVASNHRFQAAHTPSTVASLMEAVRICGGLAKTQFPTQPLKPKQ